jgi:hypothetical protein
MVEASVTPAALEVVRCEISLAAQRLNHLVQNRAGLLLIALGFTHFGRGCLLAIQGRQAQQR